MSVIMLICLDKKKCKRLSPAAINIIPASEQKILQHHSLWHTTNRDKEIPH
jgi:hypothetical protein